MFRKFLRDAGGNYLVITAISMVPIMGGLALAIDYSDLSRMRQATINACDAASVATGHYIAEGADDAEARAYARDFFDANLGPVAPEDATLVVTMPNDNEGGGTLQMDTEMTYRPHFLPVFHWLMGKDVDPEIIKTSAHCEVRLKNTLEVALVLDNSGSMDDKGKGSSKKRIDLLKTAAKQLVSTIAGQAEQMKQLPKPVQFGLVPFAGAVNIGPSMADKPWMDQDGISPIQHENFDWSTMTGNKRVEKVNGVYYKKGSGWGEQEDEKVTRFTLYKDMVGVTSWKCAKQGWGGCSEWEPTGYGQLASWQGCVEMRPYPYDLNDAAATKSNPATLYVPMFAPDEASGSDYWGSSSYNNWIDDGTSGSGAYRQAYMPKYFTRQNVSVMGDNMGPNASCTTKPITPLTDVSKAEGKTAINTAIDAMQPLGATNVTEGLAWGWRVISSGAPFTEGRKESEHGNDKVVIVLTDGANTYYTPSSLGADDLAGNKSTYSNYGYTGKDYADTDTTRLYMGLTSDSGVDTSKFDNDNYTKAMKDHMAQVCANAKAAGIMVMTVALDLNDRNSTEKAQIDSLRECASDSRFRRVDGKPVKLFWNATGATLDEKFREIADELSNLRIVG